MVSAMGRFSHLTNSIIHIYIFPGSYDSISLLGRIDIVTNFRVDALP